MGTEEMKAQLIKELTGSYGRSMTALVKEMSRDLKTPVKVTHGWPPSWNPKDNVVKLPFFVNADLLDEDDLHDGRSFIGHESGEKAHNELDPGDDRWKDKKLLKTIVNIVGDARINLKQEVLFPGFKRSHSKTSQRFLKDFKAQAILPFFDQFDDYVDSCKAYATGLCLAEFVWEGQSSFSEIMSIPNMNPKVKKTLEVLKPFIDNLHPERMSCDEIADESEAIYTALKCHDIPEQKQEQAFPDQPGETGEDGEAVEGSANGGWGNTGGRDYGQQLANALSDSDDADLCSGHHSYYGNVNSYTFDPTIDKWITYGNAKEQQAGHYEVDLDRLAMVLANRLTKLLQAPAPITTRYQTSGRLDSSRMSQVLHYRNDIFKRKIMDEEVDVSVALSIDCSSSMSSINREVRAAVSTWVKALGLVGIPTEVLGWHQRGYYGYGNKASQLPQALQKQLYRYSPITWQVIKAFHEDWRVGLHRVKYDMQFSGGTPSGEGISVPGFRLVHRNEQRKVLFVFTDGSPALAAHGPYEVHEDYIKSTVAGLRARGIEVVGVALDDYCFPMVREMFGEHASLTINGIGDLMTRQGNVMLRQVIGHSGQRGAR